MGVGLAGCVYVCWYVLDVGVFDGVYIMVCGVVVPRLSPLRSLRPPVPRCGPRLAGRVGGWLAD